MNWLEILKCLLEQLGKCSTAAAKGIESDIVAMKKADDDQQDA